ncbi:MAG: CoB--CoM heterodisulfide reductase iron-sulfur subunit B family protein [Candidatus Lokiarchaeota archaeon]|nr:CoB--CoM heterodisulfide reductase iron-sulfur subunit B family protein [Candidatus Lokiarchaeota archaeon]
MGCTIPSRTNHYESSFRAVARAVGLEFSDSLLDKWSCCGTTFMKDTDFHPWLALSAYNLALSEGEGRDIITLCNGCFNSLKEGNHILQTNPELLERANASISPLKYHGGVRVEHAMSVLYKEIGLPRLKLYIKKPRPLKVAVHYGCHFLRPAKIMQTDNPDDPTTLEELAGVTGATSVRWKTQQDCCGAPVLATNEDLAIHMISKKLVDIMDNTDAQCVLTSCPFCQIQFELHQTRIGKMLNRKIEIPVLFQTQLLGLAMDLEMEELGFDFNLTPVDSILEHFKE